MRTEALYLDDIVGAADAIARFLSDIEMASFLADELRQSAVLQKLIVIGEAAARLSDAFRDRHREIEWKDVIGFRNIAVHEYFGVSWETVWNTAIQDVPVLRQLVEAILEAEYDGPSSDQRR